MENVLGHWVACWLYAVANDTNVSEKKHTVTTALNVIEENVVTTDIYVLKERVIIDMKVLEESVTTIDTDVYKKKSSLTRMYKRDE